MNRHLFRAIVLAASATVALAACGIRPDAAPRDLPEGQRTLVDLSANTGAAAIGADRIYLVGPGEERLLKSVPREEVPGFDLIEILLLGPNEAESEAQYSTVIPANTELNGEPTRSGSTLFIDISEEINQLTGQSLTQALAQIVYTASEIEGIEQVRLRVDGEQLSWPIGNGTSTTGPLSAFDFPGYVATSQPDFPAVPARA